ncbi:hypothetical protein DITRI_Ditri02bG0042700 [Diplodiscus trichospermus]
MRKIISSTMICHDLLWIPMKFVMTPHVCTCSTSMVTNVHSPYLAMRSNGFVNVCVLDTHFCIAIRFDAGGPGSCLKRYSDPTYFKKASGSSIEEDSGKVPRDKKTHKSKKRRSSYKNGQLSHGASLSNRSGRMQFTSLIVNGRSSSSQTASTIDMAVKSDLEEHSNSVDSRNGSGYIECLLSVGSSMLPKEKESKEVSSRLMQERDTLGSNFPIEQAWILDDNLSHSSSQEQIAPSSSCVTWDEKAEILESKAGKWDRGEVPDMNFNADVQETAAANLGNGDEMDIPFTSMDAPQSSSIEYQNDETESEPDNYMDALNTIESESENDIECHTKREVEQCSENDVECQTKWEVEQNDDANNFNNENREEGMLVVMDDNKNPHPSIIESSVSPNIISSNGISTNIPDSVPSEKFASEQMHQISGKSSDPGHSLSTDLCMRDEICNGSQVESVISHPSSSSSSIVSDRHDPASDRIINSASESQNSQNTFSGVHSVGFWTNGGLLGLQPSKPPDFAVSTIARGSAAKTTEAFDHPNQHLMAFHHGPKGNSGTVVENAESTEKVPGSCGENTSLPKSLDANLEKPVNSHFNNSLDNFNGVGFSPDASFSHGNKHAVNANVKATYSQCDDENDDNSSSMFGLGHKLLVNGFHGKVTIGNDGESGAATSIKTRVLEQKTELQSISYQKIPWNPSNEQIGNGSPVNSRTSSPPLEPMKISFNPIDGFETSKLRLQFPDGNHYQESIRDIFPSFQLVPVSAIGMHDVTSDSDSDDDTFCRSSPYLSGDCQSHCSESNSEQWESGETHENKDAELYNALSRLSSTESVSGSLHVGDAVNSGIHINGENKTIVPGTGAEPSLPVSLELLSFDAISPVPPDETNINSKRESQLELQNSTELTPLPPPPPPAQWRVSKPCLDESEERQHALSESLRHEFDLKVLGSVVSQKPNPSSVNQQQIKDEAIPLKRDKQVDQDKLNRQKEATQFSSGSGMDEKEDFLLQIRTKSRNLRPTVTARTTVNSAPTTNVKVNAILQKANAIRHVVGSDDGEDDDDDNWSDT